MNWPGSKLLLEGGGPAAWRSTLAGALAFGGSEALGVAPGFGKDTLGGGVDGLDEELETFAYFGLGGFGGADLLGVEARGSLGSPWARGPPETGSCKRGTAPPIGGPNLSRSLLKSTGGGLACFGFGAPIGASGPEVLRLDGFLVGVFGS